MRRIVWGMAIMAAVSLAAGSALAQEDDSAAEKQAGKQIARMLKSSGKMRDYSIGVKYKEGTAWLSGRVANREQLETALQIVSGAEGVDQVVNNLSVAPANTAKASVATARPAAAASSDAEPRDYMVEQTAVRATATQEAPPLASGRSSLGNAKRAAAQRSAAIARTGSATSGNRSASRRVAHNAPAGYEPLDGGRGMAGTPIPSYTPGSSGGIAPASYDQPHMPGYAWPSYAAYPNYAALTYPRQYSASAWPYIGPFYPYPQVPLGWRKVTLEWDDGWWMLDFDDKGDH